MWVLPRGCNITVLWTVVQDSEYFQLLKYRSGGLMNIISTARLLNPLDGNPQPFRIVLKNGSEFLLVAVADTLDEIKRLWDKIENELLPVSKDIDDRETKVHFFCAKIGGWATLEEGEEGNKTARVQKFHSLFDTKVKEEKLLTYYDGALWSTGQLTPAPGCMYLTERCVCIDAQGSRLVYDFKDITSITKDATLPFISNAILKFQVRSKGDVPEPSSSAASSSSSTTTTPPPSQPSSFWFVLYKGANKAHETLESIWTANLNHWQSELAVLTEEAQNTRRVGIRPGSADSSSSIPGSPGPGSSLHSSGSSASSSNVPATPMSPKPILASKNTALLMRSNAVQAFSTKFLVPEEPVTEYAVSLCGLKEHAPMILGTLTLTHNFLCWSNNTLGGQRMQVVIAAYTIMNVNVTEALLGMGPKTYVQIETDEGNKFSFASLHPNQLRAEIIKMRESHKAYMSRAGAKTAGLSTTMLLRNGYQMDMAREMNAEHQDTQGRLQGHWEQYFAVYGRGSSMIMASDPLHKLLQMGIPDIYRHELWPLMCGASHKLNSNAGQYSEYLASILGKPSTAANEIDKDLHRSMPSHPYYASQPKNLEPLRNVLLAYAARNPSVGYCQGMNIVAAMLLLYLSEEMAFWVLTSIIEEIAPDYYNKQLFGSQVDQKVFNRLVKRKYPDLYKHLKEIGMPLHLLTLPWFMTFLIDCVPWDASLCVIDNLLRHGTLVLFQVALAMLSQTYEQIMAEKSENEQIPLLIRAYKFDPYDLMKMAFTKFAYIDAESIRRMRREGKAARLNDIQETAHKQALNYVRRKFKKGFKEEQFEEINRHYLSHGRGDALSFEGFKQIILTYAPFIERNIQRPTPSGDVAGETPGADSSSSSTPGEPPSAPSIPKSTTPVVDCFITPSSPHLHREPQLILTQEFSDEILRAVWSAHAKNGGGVDLYALMSILDTLLNQTPSQIFNWLLTILYPSAEHPELSKFQFERLLHGLYILNYVGDAPIDSNLARIRQFIPLVYEQLGGNAQSLTTEQIQEIVINCELLDGFWSRLYYVDVVQPSASLSSSAPSGPPAEDTDLISFD